MSHSEQLMQAVRGYLEGTISGHLREYPAQCSVDFSPRLVDLDGYGFRFSARVPFRNIKKINPK